VSAATQNQALAALLFLYSVPERNLETIEEMVRAKRPARLPVVMTRQEVAAVLSKLRGTSRLMASVLYGAGLRLSERASLRVKDVDFALSQLVVRSGKGQRDRVFVRFRSCLVTVICGRRSSTPTSSIEDHSVCKVPRSGRPEPD